MFSDETKTIFKIFEDEGVDIYIVGGAVRNPLLDEPVTDIDFAVSSPPELTQKILEKNNIRNIPTGIAHGTITAVINDKTFELTSFRKDVSTDGRRAKTEFGTSLLEDAKRRDFTLNAIYMNSQEDIIDPLEGMVDIEKGELCFIGNPEKRIQEDYLRILRYFRFLSQYDLYGCDEAIEASKRFAKKLSQISLERIGSEMKKLLAGKNALEACKEAMDAGVFAVIWHDYDYECQKNWVDYRKTQKLEQDWRVETIGAMRQCPQEDCWRLSNSDRKFMRQLDEARHSQLKPLHLGEFYGEEIAQWAWHIKHARAGNIPKDIDFKQISRGSHAKFPVNGNDIRALGIEGAPIGRTLRTLKEKWRESDYGLDKETLISMALNLKDE